MADINDGGPAFPAFVTEAGMFGPVTKQIQPGMSLRDWYAGQALCGWIQSGAVAAIREQHGMADPPMAFPVLAEACYAVADAMIAARVK